MKYTKGVVSAIAVLSLFSASCLIATYKINQDVKAMQLDQVSMLKKTM